MRMIVFMNILYQLWINRRHVDWVKPLLRNIINIEKYKHIYICKAHNKYIENTYGELLWTLHLIRCALTNMLPVHKFLTGYNAFVTYSHVHIYNFAKQIFMFIYIIYFLNTYGKILKVKIFSYTSIYFFRYYQNLNLLKINSNIFLSKLLAMP